MLEGPALQDVPVSGGLDSDGQSHENDGCRQNDGRLHQMTADK